VAAKLTRLVAREEFVSQLGLTHVQVFVTASNDSTSAVLVRYLDICINIYGNAPWFPLDVLHLRH
jgi:hypothetical protein